MKNSKKLIVLLILAGSLVFGSESCKKYDEGSLISFKSRTDRVANMWKVDNYKKNGNDYTSLVTDYREVFTTAGDYSYTWGVLSGTGKWAFQNNDSEIKLTGIDNQASYTLVILKLEEKAFWYYYMDGSDKKEYHMVQQ